MPTTKNIDIVDETNSDDINENRITNAVAKKKTLKVYESNGSSDSESDSIVHPKIRFELRSVDSKKGPLTVDQAKKLLGWTEEPTDKKWGHDFILKDRFSKKIRLLNNPSNRPYKPSIAKRYSSEILRGKWKLNLETIVIGRSGEVRDGQHRLIAFVLAEQDRLIDQKQWGSEPLTLEVLLGFGVSDDQETADSFDKGQSRSLDDVIYRHEDFGDKIPDRIQRKIARALSGALRLVWLRSGGRLISNAPHFPHSEALEFYEAHPGILSSVKYVIALDDGEGNEKCISSLITLPYAAGLHYMMKHVNSDQADEFWSSLASGDNLGKGSPILALRSYLTKAKASSGIERDHKTGGIIKAWLAFIDDKNITVKHLTLKKSKSGDKFVYEDPRIGGLDKKVSAPKTLSTNQMILLSCLASNDKEMTYKSISEETGLPKSLISKIATDDGDDSLSDLGLIETYQYEPEAGQRIAPIFVSITESGINRCR